jgi:hypothetical protein
LKHLGQISYPYVFLAETEKTQMMKKSFISVCIFGLNGKDANEEKIWKKSRGYQRTQIKKGRV